MTFIYVDEPFVKALQRDIQSGHRPALAALLRTRADKWLEAGPWRITDYPSPAASGNPHDYYSEGPYWWPDPENPSGPYIRRDGEVNSAHFTAHRQALQKVADSVKDLSFASFYLGEPHYARRAAEVLRVWFLDEATRMNPHLEYGQAIRGICDGRGIGIIDTNCLVGLAHALCFLAATGEWKATAQEAMRNWLASYLRWLTQSEKGLDEKRQKNNHGTYWAVQVGTYAAFLGETAIVDQVTERYKNVLVPQQITPAGALPLEEARTKSFSYTLMNANGLALLCELAHYRGVDLWSYQTADGRSMARVVEYLAPYLERPARWTKQQIVPFTPKAQLFLQWAALRLDKPQYAAINRGLGGEGDSLIGPLPLLPGLYPADDPTA